MHNIFPATFPLINVGSLKLIGGNLQKEDREILQAIGVKKIYSKNMIVLSSGSSPNSLIYIEEGLVRYTFSNYDGMEKVIFYIGEGCFIGLEALFHEQLILYDAIACSNIKLIMVDKKRITELLLRPSISYALLKMISLTSRIMAIQIEDLIFRDVEARICRILACLEEANPAKSHCLTHQTIACLIGSHRVTVTDVMKKLKKEGIIRNEKNGFIIVTDFEKLCSRAFVAEKNAAKLLRHSELGE